MNGGQAGETPAGAPSDHSGGTSSGGRGGAGPTTSGGTTGAGGSSSAGDAGESSAGEGGTSGAGSDGGSGAGGQAGSDTAGGTLTVRGKVENRWGYPLSDVSVTIGAASAVTDSEGSFEIANVTAPYDAWFVAEVTYDPQWIASEAWLFHGLTRATPVFRVARGGIQGSSRVEMTTTGLASGATVVGAVGLPRGLGFQTTKNATVDTDFSMEGEPIQHGTGHTLTYLTDVATGFPKTFLSYAALPMDADSSRLYSADLHFDVTPSGTELPSAAIRGAVTSVTTASRQNALWLRFDSNAAIPLIQTTPSGQNFEYLVPDLPESNVTLAASEGDPGGLAAYAVGFLSGLSPGQSGIELEIPSSVALGQPAKDATINSATSFSWSKRTPVSVLRVDDATARRVIRVVTAEDQAQIPDAVFAAVGFERNAGGAWCVETYGNQPNVDAAVSGPDFVPAFFDEFTIPRGHARESGAYTRSALRRYLLGE
jgi:hypothetical protein